tara:strand:+ start:39 stop:380 length:342 start_codon:yes stop_codon:yes gene_type:complete
MIEYLIIGGNGWCVDPDFKKAYTQWKFYAGSTRKETRVVIYQVDTSHLDYEEGQAPVWVDGMGFNTHWKWKELKENRTVDSPLTTIYSGPLSKAPKTNKDIELAVALDKIIQE